MSLRSCGLLSTSEAYSHRYCDIMIDNRPSFRYKLRISLIKGRLREGTPEKRSECGARGREDTARTRAASGIIGPALRPVWEVRSLDWDGRARVTPV
jgi:hypothetical protein